MSNSSSLKLSNNEVAAVMGNLLKLAFFENTRTNAKRSYRELEDGKKLRLPALTVAEDSRVEVTLTMDMSERRGKLAFSSFKQHLAAVLERMAIEMQDNDVPMLASDDGMQRVINLPIAHKTGGHINVLALGFHLQQAELEINLLFLDPAQFASQGASAA